MEEKKRRQEEAAKWEELRKIQSREGSGDYEMPPLSPLDEVQPTTPTSWPQSPIFNESASITQLGSAQKQEETMKWDELRKIQSGDVGGDYEIPPISPLDPPLQPTKRNSVTKFTDLHRKDLAPKRKSAPKPPVPAYSKRQAETQPVPIIKMEVPTPVTSPVGSWDPKFDNIPTVTTAQFSMATTTSSSSNVKLKSDQSKSRNLIKELSTVSLQQGLYSSTTEDELTKSTHVSASAELV